MATLLVTYLIGWAGALALCWRREVDFWNPHNSHWDVIGPITGGALAWWLLPGLAWVFSVQEVLDGTPWSRTVQLLAASMGLVVGCKTHPYSSCIGLGWIVLNIVALVLLVVGLYIWTGENQFPMLLDLVEKIKDVF